MAENLNVFERDKVKSKFTTPGSLKFLLIFLSIAALVAGFLMGLQIFESLGEFKRLGIFLIIGSIIGAVMLIAMVKILNDLTYIKNRLEKNNE
jgi:uncharacterized membrane protein YeaQ/YmgE (transglycosylase-associated protein family)